MKTREMTRIRTKTTRGTLGGRERQEEAGGGPG